jgi:hypothetical protein
VAPGSFDVYVLEAIVIASIGGAASVLAAYIAAKVAAKVTSRAQSSRSPATLVFSMR